MFQFEGKKATFRNEQKKIVKDSCLNLKGNQRIKNG